MFSLLELLNLECIATNNHVDMAAYVKSLQLLFYLAPSSPPQNLLFTSVNSTAINITFSPPVVTDQNGIIRFYTISYRGLQIDTTLQSRNLTLSPRPIYPAMSPQFFAIVALQEYNDYTITVTASTDAGESAYNTITVQTLPAGECYLLSNTISVTLY